MELILIHWWKFVIIVIVLVIGTIRLGDSLDKTLKMIRETIIELANEIKPFQNESPRATAINIIMLIFLGIAMLALIIPNILAQLGLIEDDISIYLILVLVLFVVVGFGSGYGLGLFRRTLPGFKDDDIEYDSGEKRKSKSKKKLSKKAN